MDNQKFWAQEIAIIGIKKEQLPMELEYILKFNNPEFSNKAINNIIEDGDIRNTIKKELEKMSQKDFMNYSKRVGFNFLEMNDDYSILTDEDLTNNDSTNIVNEHSIETFQDWQLSLNGYKDGDNLIFGNIYNSDGRDIGTAEIELAGENELSYRNPFGAMKSINNIEEYKDLLLNISTSYLAYTDSDDVASFVYDKFQDKIYKDLNIKTKEDYVSILSESSLHSHKELENANNYTAGYISDYLSFLNTVELENFAQKYHDKDFKIDNSMSSSIYADIKDTNGNILLYNDESYSNMVDTIYAIKRLTNELFEKELTLYLVYTNNSDKVELMQMEYEDKKNQFYCDAITKGNIDYKDILGTLAKIDKGVYTFDLNNIALYGNSHLNTDKSLDIEFENRQIHIVKSHEGVAVDVYCDEVLTNELGWLSNEDIEDLEEKQQMKIAETDYPFAYATIGYFIDKNYDNEKIDDVVKEIYTRTNNGSNIEYELNTLMFAYEYNYLENLEDINEQVKEIIGDDPNCSIEDVEVNQKDFKKKNTIEVDPVEWDKFVKENEKKLGNKQLETMVYKG